MADLIAGHVEGWKCLYFDKDGRLHSPSRDMVWTSRTQSASCSRDHRGADEGCPCGLYASRSVDGALEYQGFGKNFVLARVRGYGQVTEGDQAWRAEHMEIVSLWADRNDQHVLMAFPYWGLVGVGLFGGVSMMGAGAQLWDGHLGTTIGAAVLFAVGIALLVVTGVIVNRFVRFMTDTDWSFPSEFDGIPVHDGMAGSRLTAEDAEWVRRGL